MPEPALILFVFVLGAAAAATLFAIAARRHQGPGPHRQVLDATRWDHYWQDRGETE